MADKTQYGSVNKKAQLYTSLTTLKIVAKASNTMPQSYKIEDIYTIHTTLPHDANVREIGTGKSRVEIAQSLGFDD